MPEKLTTTVHITREETQALRELAAHFNMYYTTGPMAGKLGNPRTLVAKLAKVYQQYPEETVHFLSQIFQDRSEQ